MPRAITVLVFLILTAESKDCFEQHWSTPWSIFERILFFPVPGVRLPLMDVIFICMLPFAYAKKGARTGRVKPIDNALWLSLATIFAWVLYGMSTGASPLDMRLQIHALVVMYFFSFLFITALRTPEHFMELGKAIVYAALFRYVMAFLFYQMFVKKGVTVACILDHGDTMIFAAAIVLTTANALHVKSRKATMFALFVAAAMLWSIIVNNRRLAYIALIGGLIVLYSLVSAGIARKRLKRTISILIPIIAVYVSVGWGREERIFKPLASFSSMGPESNDPSTESRNLENLGLVNTMRTAPVMGLGFGHEYIEYSSMLAPVKIFPMYRFVPHNSVLGLASFMGALGLFGVWLAFPICVYFAARSYRFARTPSERTIAVGAAAITFIHINECYGDIGINAHQGLVMMPLAFAASSRLAALTGAWEGGRKKKAAPSRASQVAQEEIGAPPPRNA